MARGGNRKDERERAAAFPFSLHSPSLAREARVPPAIWLPGTPVLTQNVPGVASAMGAVAGQGGRGDGHGALADISADAGAGRLIAIRRQPVPTFLGRCLIASGSLNPTAAGDRSLAAWRCQPSPAPKRAVPLRPLAPCGIPKALRFDEGCQGHWFCSPTPLFLPVFGRGAGPHAGQGSSLPAPAARPAALFLWQHFSRKAPAGAWRRVTTREAAPPTPSPAKNTKERPRPLSPASLGATSIPLPCGIPSACPPLPAPCLHPLFFLPFFPLGQVTVLGSSPLRCTLPGPLCLAPFPPHCARLLALSVHPGLHHPLI